MKQVEMTHDGKSTIKVLERNVKLMESKGWKRADTPFKSKVKKGLDNG